MTAPEFAAWLAELLQRSDADATDGRFSIVITDADFGSAEVLFDGEWVWDSEVDLPTLRTRLRLVEE